MIIPKNVSDLKRKLDAAFKGKPAEKTKDDDVSRRTASNIHKEREARRKLTEELKSAQTTAERKEQIIAELQQKLETSETELSTLRGEVERLSPEAKQWSDHQNKERARIIATFPTEEQKEAKKLGETMPLDSFRKYAERVTGKGGSTGAQQGASKDGKKDWEAILKGDPVAAEKAIAEDGKGFNEYMDAANK